MQNYLINKIKECFKAENATKFKEFLHKFVQTNKVSQNYHCHLINLFILIGSYVLGSLLIYPELSFSVFFKEFFSIVCIYGAILCWFTEKCSENNTLRLCLAVTTCLAPVIFMNNSFSVAVICLMIIVLVEYVIFSYMQGHKLFSKFIPVYLICEEESDLKTAYDLLNKYKVLELVFLSTTRPQNLKLSKIQSIEGISRQLEGTRNIPFYPQPRKFIYCAERKNLENLSKLLELAAEYSIPVMTAAHDGLAPLALRDLAIGSESSERNSLTSLFKNKNIWVCYDGRRTVMDLISILSGIASVNLTIICESARLMPEIDRNLSQINSFKNYRIKTTDLTFLTMSEARPDILFYNMPIKTQFSDEDHLKEALVKNAIDTDKMIKLAQGIKIPLTFVLSSTNSMNANNWTGATQRLGELLCQHADFQCRKNSARFKVIRIPENVSDQYGFLGEITASVLHSGNVFINSAESDLSNLYNAKDIISLTLKAIMLAYKSEKTAEVLTILPKDKADPKDLINKVCNLHGLKPDRDVKVHYARVNEAMELDNFPNISETLDKTSVANIFLTKFVTSSIGNYNDLWTVEQISQMNPREIISAVFQSISDKINPQNR